MRLGTELGRGGLTLLVSLLVIACSEKRTLYPGDDVATRVVDGGDEIDGRDAGSEASELPMSVSSGDGRADDTEPAVTNRHERDAGSVDGGSRSNTTRPTFLPDERPLPTPELIEPDPVEINVGDNVPVVALRLARFIWRTAPDATTVALARQGELETAQEVYEEAQRMLADPRAKQGFLSFFGAWAEVTNTVESGLTQLPGDGGIMAADGGAEVEFGVAARAELDNYLLGLVSSGAGLRELVQQSFEVHEPALEELFAGEPSIVRTGAFSQPYLLAAGSWPDRPSPSRRGAFIARRLLCEDFSASQHPDVGTAPDDGTVRAWLKQETKPKDCAECHAVIDQLGFALEGFDEHGRARTSDNGQTVDTEVDLGALGLPDADGPETLGVALLYHRNTLPCVLSQWFRYALQREPRAEDDASWIELVRGSEFYELREIPALIAATQSFRSE
jgi:hypothetical protein